jgi:hypothetical protein
MNDVNRTIARNRKMMVERSERSQKTPEREKNGLYSQENREMRTSRTGRQQESQNRGQPAP